MLTLLRRTYGSLGHLVRELLKFGVVGGLAFVIDLAVFNTLRFGLGVGPLTSKTLSVFVAATAAYVGNRFWTFRHRARAQEALHREYLVFLVLNGVGLAISLAVLAVSHYALGLTSALADNIAANGIGLVLATAFRFLAYRRWVFPAVAEAEALAEADEQAAVSATRPSDVARD